MAQAIGSLLLLWETLTEFWTAGFGLARGHLGLKPAGGGRI